MNETIQTILSRRSVRRYANRPIPEDLLAQVLDCGLYAPSGGNHQVTRLTAIQNRAVLDELVVLVREELSALELAEGQYHNKSIQGARANPNYNFCFHTNCLIVASGPIGWPNGMVDCGCALENMMLAAHALGIGSCWVNQLRWLSDCGNQRLARFLAPFGIGGDERVNGALALGYPDGPPPTAAPRKENRIRYVR